MREDIMSQPQSTSDDNRLMVLLIAPVASIAFALLSLFFAFVLDNAVGMWSSLVICFLVGTLSFVIGFIMLIFQISRNQLNIRNTLLFGAVSTLAFIAFLGSCVAGASTLD